MAERLKPKKSKARSKKVLFIHQRFPGQFAHLAKSLAEDGHEVLGLCFFPPSVSLDGVKVKEYTFHRSPLITPPFLLQEFDAKLLRAEGVAKALKELREEGFTPDVIYAHPGWGEAFFLRNVFPDSKLIMYGEWYYNLKGQEVNFDPEFPLSEEEKLRLQLKNTAILHGINDADVIISPTSWQKSRFPSWAHKKTEVIHEGIDLTRVRMGVTPKAIKVEEKGIEIKYGDPVITYASRYLEPVRGFHIFMRALPKILEENKKARVFILGDEVTSGYGKKHPEGKTWKQALLEELNGKLDLERIHFMGFLPYVAYLSILRISACHVYLTYPFVLSWSFLETAVIGVPIVASSTQPVLEFKDNIPELHLVDFLDNNKLAESVLEVLEKPIVRMPANLDELDLKNTLPKIKQRIF